MENSLQIISERPLTETELTAGAPVAVTALQVAYDYTYNREVLFVKGTNRSGNTLRSLYFDLVCFDDAGDRLGEVPGACIRSLEAAPDGAFGENSPVVIPFSGTCKVEFALQKVVFTDGTVWRAGDAPIEAAVAPAGPEAVDPLPDASAPATEAVPEEASADETASPAPAQIPDEWLNPPATVEGYRAAAEGLAALNDPSKSYLAKKFAALGDKLEAEAAEAARKAAQAELAAKQDADYNALLNRAPETADEWDELAAKWKALGNYKDAPKRSAGALKKSKSMRASEKRAIAKEAEAARIAAEQKAARRKARTKAGIIMGAVLLAITALILLTVFVAIPASRQDRYDAAEALIAEGKYTEAMNAFYALGNFSDSAERIKELKLSLAGREDALFFTTESYPCYTIDENGTLSYNSAQYRINNTEIYIPDYFDDQKVTALSASIFTGMDKVTKIVLAPSVTSVGASAFADCTSLTEFVAPSLISIGAEAFRGCTSLIELTLPNTLTGLGEYAFQGCTALQKIVLPESLRKLSDSLFLGCTALAEVEFSSRLTTVGDSAFAYCAKLTALSFPETLESVGNNAFLSCTGLTELTLPASVTSMGDKAMSGCTSLTKVTVNGSVTKIPARAFEGCKALAEITLPASLTQIGYSAFTGCTALTTVRFAGSETAWGQVDIQTDNEPLTSAAIQYGE